MNDHRPRRQVSVIGIGAGGVDLLTAEASAALRELDAVIVISKGEERDHLLAPRRAVLAAHASPTVRVLEVVDPVRANDVAYREAVGEWHRERARRVGEAVAATGPDERIGILVWGDPSLYDSALRLLEMVEEQADIALEVTVIPGITSIQLLAAAHRIVLHRVGGSFLVTTRRRLAEGEGDGFDDVVVMLNSEPAFTRFIGRGYDLYWGAYLGDENQVLRSGELDEIADEVTALRAELTERHGWMFDIYLLRRRLDRSPGG